MQSRETGEEAAAITQVRDGGGLDQGDSRGGGGKESWNIF